MEPARPAIDVEVVYALASRQYVRQVKLVDGATAGDAVLASRLAEEIPEVGLRPPLARFGRLIAWDAQVRDGDRVDILRTLRADPKESRRRRAEVQSSLKKNR